MEFGLIVCLLLLGFFLATEYVIAVAPGSEQFVEKLEPYRGWIGLGLALTGVWWTLNYLFIGEPNIFTVFRSSIEVAGLKITIPFKSRLTLWIIYFTAILPSALLMLFGGFLLGFDKIAQYTGKGDQLEAIKAKIQPYQRKIGVVSLCVAVWLLLLRLAWS